MKHKVLITTSGIGSRLGDLTKYTNKSLVRIGTKPAIAHIIESYPQDTHFVITLGHFAEHVRDFIELAYPELHVEFVIVENYRGEGSSLGLSMLAAQAYLQCPFVYHASDTLITAEVPAPKENWIGVFCGNDTSQYASWTQQEGALRLHEKGAIDTDFIHVGLVGVHDYTEFWRTLESLHEVNPDDQSLNDCQVLSAMIARGVPMDVVEFPVWHDIGNVDALHAAREAAGDTLDDLDKSGEAVFIFDDFVIKFFADETVVQHRAERGYLLKGLVPEMQGARGNFYRYRYVPGELYSHVVQPQDFREFLSWAQDALWVVPEEDKITTFYDACYAFYHDKTQQRVGSFFEKSGLRDVEHIINTESVPKITTMLSYIDFEKLAHGLPSQFHGDFILDNVLKTDAGYCLIDWRQDFGGLVEVGDRYYDLAKLNHNLTVNHRIINRGQFSVHAEGAVASVEILRPSALVECQEVFDDFLEAHGYDSSRVALLTALIWLNMAPLHHHPFDLFLYYFGKLHLWRSLQKVR